MIPMYASWSLRRLLMPLLFASTQSCKTLSSSSVSPVYPRCLSTQLRLNTLLQRTSLPSSMGPVKVHLLITHYVDQNESFLFFQGKDILKWIYKCNQYFDVEEIAEHDKLKLASYYLDGMASCWHQNFMRSLGGQVVSWHEYVEALCCRFRGGGREIYQKNSLN